MKAAFFDIDGTLKPFNEIELRDTTMSKNHRVLKQITVDDAMAADAAFNLLMSDDVDPRKEFIVSNAGYVNNLDI